MASSSSAYEPSPRFWHISASVGRKVVVQGGRTKDFSAKSSQYLTSVVEIFDPYSESWEQRQVTGDAPLPGTHSAACTSLNDDLFSFGGRDDADSLNTLHRLDTKAWRWCKLSPQNADGAPMPKYGCGMVAFSGILGVFGGYGIPGGPTEPRSFIENTAYAHGKGWTNEFHIYKYEEGVWSCPATTGERPPPCSSFTFTAIDHRRAVMVGGNYGKQCRLNDVFIIDTFTMHWTKLNKSGVGLWPEEISSHAACCLNYGQQFPQLVVTGGLNKKRKPLSNIWILDVVRGRWRKVNVTLRPQYCHSATASSLGPGLTVVTVFGGTAEPWAGTNETQPKLAHTTLLYFRLVESSGGCEWELLSVVDNTQRGSVEWMVEKMKCIAEFKPQSTSESVITRMKRQKLEAERDRARLEKQAAEEKVREMEGEKEKEREENKAVKAVVGEMKDAVNQMKDRVREVEGEREREREEKQAVQEMAREMEDTVRQMKDRVREMEAKREREREEKQAVQEMPREMEDIVRQMKDRVREMEAERERERKEKQTTEDILLVIEGQREREREEKQAAQEMVNKMEDMIYQLEGRVSQLVGEKEREREDKIAAQKVTREMEDTVRQMKDRVREMEAEREREREENVAAQEVVREMEDKVMDAEKRRGRAVEEKRLAEVSIGEIQDILRQMEHRVSKIEMEKEAIKIKKQAAEMRVGEMENTVKQIEIQMKEMVVEKKGDVMKKQAADSEIMDSMMKSMIRIKEGEIRDIEDQRNRAMIENRRLQDILEKTAKEWSMTRVEKQATEERLLLVSGERDQVRVEKRAAEQQLIEVKGERDRNMLELQQRRREIEILRRRLERPKEIELLDKSQAPTMEHPCSSQPYDTVTTEHAPDQAPEKPTKITTIIGPMDEDNIDSGVTKREDVVDDEESESSSIPSSQECDAALKSLHYPELPELPTFPDVIAEETILVTNEEKLIVREECGFSLHIPSYALPDDCSDFLLNVKITSSSDFLLPTSHGIIVSAFYSFSHNLGENHLRLPVTLRMQHCATTTSLDKLCIVRADSDEFHIIPDGVFTDDYGSVELQHFCTLGIYLQWFAASMIWTLKPCASLHYTHIKHDSFQFHLYVVPWLNALLKGIATEIEKKFCNVTVEHGPTSSSPLAFEENRETIWLEIPDVTYEGWKMDALNSLEKRVDDIVNWRYSPSPFTVQVAWSKSQHNPQRLVYQTKLIGVKGHHLKVTTPTLCDIIPTASQSATAHTSSAPNNTDTPQYKAILNFSGTIIERLKTTKSVQPLLWKFREKQWIAITTDFNEGNVVTCALDKIRQDASHFSTLIQMLANIEGMEDIIDNIMRRVEEYNQ